MSIKNPTYKFDWFLLIVLLAFLSGTAVWVYHYTAMVRGVMP